MTVKELKLFLMTVVASFWIGVMPIACRWTWLRMSEAAPDNYQTAYELSAFMVCVLHIFGWGLFVSWLLDLVISRRRHEQRLVHDQ